MNRKSALHLPAFSIPFVHILLPFSGINSLKCFHMQTKPHVLYSVLLFAIFCTKGKLQFTWCETVPALPRVFYVLLFRRSQAMICSCRRKSRGLLHEFWEEVGILLDLINAYFIIREKKIWKETWWYVKTDNYGAGCHQHEDAKQWSAVPENSGSTKNVIMS